MIFLVFTSNYHVLAGKRKRPFSGQFFYLLDFFAVFDLAFDLAFAMRGKSLHRY